MKIKNTIIYVVVMFILFGCYEDKGNYDYKEINEIEISGIQMNSYIRHYGDTLQIKPELKFSGDTARNLKFTWLLNMNEVIGTAKDLTYVISDTLSSNEHLLFCIEDVDTGYKVQSEGVSLSLSSHFQSGWLVLSERENKSCLDFFNRNLVDEEESTYELKEYYNIFRESEKFDLGDEPVCLHEHWRDGNNDPGHVLVVQGGKNTCLDLYGNTLRLSQNTADEFITLPENFNPKDVLFAQNYSYILNNDGKLFARRNYLKSAYYSGRFSNYPVGFKDNDKFTELNVDRFVYDIDYIDTHFILVYEKEKKRFLALSDFIHYNDLNTVGSIISIESDCYTGDQIRLHNTGDNKLIFTGGCDSQGYSCTRLYNIYKTKDGNYVDQQMDISINQYSASVTVDIKDVKQRYFPVGYINDNIIVNLPDGGNGNGSTNVFFANGNKIYYYSRVAKDIEINEFYTFESDVVAMDDVHWDNSRLCVGLSNGQLLIMNISNKALGDKSVERVLHKSSRELGKIKQVIYKKGSFAM